MARDAGTKIDQPSDQEGRGTPPKEAVETKDAAQEVAQQKAAEAAEAPKPKRARRKPAAKKAEGTAAAQTGVEKEAAEAALEGAEAPGPAEEAEARAEAKPEAEAKAEARAGAKPEAEAKAEAKPKPAARPRRSRAKKAAEEPAAGEPAAEEPAAKAAPPAPAKSARAARRRRREQDAAVTVRATARFVRTSPRKARLLTDHIKGKTVDEARAILAYSPRSVAEAWRKLLESAVANAENNHDLVGDDLRILNATADDGPTLKRFRPRAMGRATRIRKRTSHLTITLTPKE
jgi:ribosomal protein L22